MDMKEIKAAAEHFIASGDISLHGQTALARFALAAIPVIADAEKCQYNYPLIGLRAALAKLREG